MLSYKNTFLHYAGSYEPASLTRSFSAPDILCSIQDVAPGSDDSLGFVSIQEVAPGFPRSLALSLSRSIGLCPRPSIPSASSMDQWSELNDDTVDQETTVMIRHIPRKYKLQCLLGVIADITHAFDFVYLPASTKRLGNAGYAFVNFTSPDAARLFREKFIYFSQGTKSEKTYVRGSTSFSRMQGLRPNMTKVIGLGMNWTNAFVDLTSCEAFQIYSELNQLESYTATTVVAHLNNIQ